MTAAPNSPAPWRWTLLASLPALLLLGWQVAMVWPFFSDDAFISLRYSDRLLAGHGLSWTDGERVEGYSNLLWVLLCAGLGALGLDLVTAARWLGGTATALALLTAARALRPANAAMCLPAAAAPLLLASTQVALGWTLAGLEGPLVLCLLTFAFGSLLTSHRRLADVAAWPRRWLLAAGVPFALVCWTRPDGPLWVFAAGVALAIGCGHKGLGRAVDRAFWLGALPLLAVVLQLLFRLAYHGDVVPNTAHVKAELDPQAFAAGADYVLAAIRAHTGSFAAAAVAVLVLVGARQRVLAMVLVLPVLCWLLYLAAVGGDHFPGRRLLHGAIAPLALLAAAALASLPRAGWQLAATAPLLLASTWNAWLARNDAQSHELAAEVWEWRGEVVGRELQREFGDRAPLLGVDAAGAVPFFSRLPALDLLGLCDRTIATTPFPAWLQTMRPEMPRPPGHLRGNGDHVMARGPDLMLFSNPPGLPLPVFVSAAEFEDDPRFLQRYRCVLVELGQRALRSGGSEELRMPLWLRRDGVLGPQRRGQDIEIPAWWFGAHAMTEPVIRRHQPPTGDASDAAAAAGLAAIAAFYTAPPAVALATGTAPWQLELRGNAAAMSLPLPAGRWQWQCEPAEPSLQLQCAAEPPLPTGGVFVQPSDGEVTLTLCTAPGAALPLRVQTVRLRRVD